MARTKHGRTAERVATAAELQLEITEKCELAKRYADNPAKYKEAHAWINDLIDQWRMARMMMPR